MDVAQSQEKALIQEKPAIKAEQLIKTTQSWDGSTLPGYAQGQPEITVLKVTIEPGATVPWHKHPIINAGYILKGKIQVMTKEGVTTQLKADDAVVELVDHWHEGINTGTEPVEIIVFYAGVEDSQLSILKQSTQDSSLEH